MPTATKLPKVSQYVKNVGKSIAFASIEGVKGNMPGMTNFAKENKETFRDIYGSVKNIRDTMNSVERDFKNTNLYRAIEYGVKNMKEDAKTGNFYNKSRMDEDIESILGMDEYDSNYEEYEVNHPNSSSTKATYEAFNASMNEFTIGTSTAVARGTEILTRSNKASTTFIASQIERSTATLHSGIGSVYNSVNRVNAFLNGPMMAHLENSKRYYESSLSIMQEQKAMIGELLEMQRNLYKVQSTMTSGSKLDEIMDSNGMPNLKAYAKNIKSNIMNAPGAFGMLGMMSGEAGFNAPMYLASAPFALMMDAMVGLLTPKNLKKNMKLFDTAMSSVFSNFIAKINKNKNSGGEFAYLLGSIFGIDIGRKNTINTSNYNKGPVPFDGITRKTIVEVIPGYLARIEAALTGAGERHYDPHKGVWKSAKNIEKDFDTERNKHIRSGNYEIETDLRDYKRRLSSKDAASLEKSLQIMMTKIFEDGGVFEPGITSSGKRDRNGRAVRKTSGDAYKKYGFKSKAQFEAVLSQLSDSTFYGLASANMRARNNWNNTLKRYENDGGVYNLMFNGAYDPTGSGNRNKMSPSKFASNNILTIARDKFGNNIFDYLKEISEAVKFKSGRYTPPKTKTARSRTVKVRTVRSASSASSEDSSDDGDSDGSDDSWIAAGEELYQEQLERENRRTFSGWVRDKLEGTAVGRSMSKYMDAMGKIFAAPIRFTDKLLQKANDNLFKMMFGDGDLRDGEGHKITNVFEYIMAKIKNSFNELTNWIKTKLKNVLDPLWNKIKPYAEPVIGEMKSMGRAAYNRVKKGLNNTLFKRLNRGEVVSADEVEEFNPQADDEDFYEGIVDSASGRYVTKRGLTMISPGEIIIPASFDKKKQKKMLTLEKRDRRRILKHIGLNAEGNVDTDKLKNDLSKIYEENKGETNVSRNIASGIMGAGAGLLTGINPLLAAMAGAGLSILNNSDTLKNMVFGKVISENGDREGGIIPKNLQDAYKKYMPDMTDFGIAGGVLGLFTPFGLLGGAAIGAGVGFLKNNENFKKFIFGDEALGKDGLISKESWEKAKGMVKKAAPNIALGAGAAILAGPFGLVGNAALGAGIGLLSSTEGFHDFLFNKETGLLSAFNNGFLQPAKEKLEGFLEDFKSYAKKNIIEPMKNFWKPFNQMLVNTITGIGEHIADRINDSFENLIGLPLHDFMQEKVFKPVGKLVFGILKAPVAVGKAIVAAPFRTLGAIGNSMTASQIRHGSAYNMSAGERLAWRDKHKIRFNPLRSDKYRDQDVMLNNMSIEDLESLSSWARAGVSSEAQLQRDFGAAKKDISNSVSSFFNTNTADGKNRFNRVGYNDVNSLTEMAQNGSLASANLIIDSMNLSSEEKKQLKAQLADKISVASSARNALANHRADASTMDKEVSKLIGRKFKGRSDRRQMYKSAEAELKARRSAAAKEELSDETNAVDNLSQIVKEKSDSALDTLEAIKTYVKEIVHPEVKDTSPPGNRITNNIIDTSNPNDNTSLMEATQESVKVKQKEKDEDSKEAVEERNEEEEKQKVTAENTEANKKSVSVLESIKEALVGDGSKKKNGFLSTIMEKVGKFGKYIGMAGLALTGVSLAGHASQWFKVSVWPKLKVFLFGTKDSEGNVEKVGLIGKIGEKFEWLFGGIKKVLFGDKDQGKEGLIPKITGWIAEKINKVADWFTKEGGFTGLFVNKIVPNFITGIGYAINNIVAPVTGLILRALPSLLRGLGKALLEGMKIAIFNKKLSKSGSSTNIEVNDGGAFDAMSSMQDTINSSIESSEAGVSAPIKSAFGNLKAAIAGNGGGQSYIDVGGIFSDSGDEKSGGVLGVLGQTTRNNEVEYDENGNPISDYTLKNKTDSILSAGAKAAGRNLLKGLGGASTIGGSNAISVIKSAGKGILNIVTPGIGSTIKGVGQVATAGVKAVSGGIGTAGSAGTALNNALQKSANYVGKYATDEAAEAGTEYVGKYLANKAAKIAANSADEVAGAAVKSGILSGIKNMFKEIAGSKIVSSIAKYATIMTSKTITSTAVKEVIEKIGKKLGETIISKLATKALSGIAGLLAKFSPLTLAMFVIDFLYGFNNAYTILGVSKDSGYNVNLAVKCACGLVNMLTNFFTLGLLPADIIMDIVIEFLFPLFGVNAEALNKAREDADNILDEWNRQHPDQAYNNLEDYNNKDKWTTKTMNWFKNLFKGNSRTTTATTAAQTPTTATYTAGSGRNNAIGMLYGKGRFGRAHIYQSSSALSNIPYGDSTIGEAGCAPVAAANLINGLGRSNVFSVLDAASYAERHGMTVPGGGTDINYFKSYLGSKGIPTKGTSNSSTALNALRNGNQVIMLGQDRNNGSSAPFGTEPHFVTAKGISRNGNVIVEDPDLPNSTYEYSPRSIKNSMISSVIADTRHRKRGRGRLYGRAQVIGTTVGSNSTGNGKQLYARAIINVATSQLGVSEGPAINDVKYNSAYYGQRVSGSSYEWSTVFVWWCFNQAGASSIITKRSNAVSLMIDFKAKKQYTDKIGTRRPAIGDIIFIKEGGATAANKTGIVISVSSNTVAFIQGDYAGKVANRYLGINHASIVGYAHPKYPYYYSSSGVVSMNKWGDKRSYKDIAFGTVSPNVTPPSDNTNTNTNTNNNNTTVETDDNTITQIDNSINEATQDQQETKKSGLLDAMRSYTVSIIKSMFGESAFQALFPDETTGFEDSNESTDGSTESTNTSSNTGTTSSAIDYKNPGNLISSPYNTKAIYEALKKKGYSRAGIAGIMGNMNCESAYKADNVQDAFEGKVGNDTQYTNAVNNLSYTEDMFNHDSVGYGLTQNTWWTKKQGLYNHTVKKGRSIGDMQGQIDALADYLSKNQPSLNSYLKSTTDIVGASDKFLYQYENPSNPELTINKRRDFAFAADNTYGGKGRAKSGMATRSLQSVSSGAGRRSGGAGTTTVVTTESSDYIVFLKAIIDLLSNVSTNTAVLYKILELLSDRLGITVDTSAIESGERIKVMNDLLSKTSDASTKAKLMNDKDTGFLLSAMMALASE